MAKSTTPHEIATIATIATTATILITIKATNCLAAVATNARSANERLRQSFQANLARFMAIKPGTPTRTAAIILKIASRATAIVTTDKSACMTLITTVTTMSTGSPAMRSLKTVTITCQSRARKTQNRARAARAEAKAASANMKITMLTLVKYLKKRGRSMRLRGLHSVRRRSAKRNHSIPKCYFKGNLKEKTFQWEANRIPMTSQICSSSTIDSPHQWNLGKRYQSHVRLKIVLYRMKMI